MVLSQFTQAHLLQQGSMVVQGGGGTDGTGEKILDFSGRKRWKEMVGGIGRSTTNTIAYKYYSTVSYFLVL